MSCRGTRTSSSGAERVATCCSGSAWLPDQFDAVTGPVWCLQVDADAGWKPRDDFGFVNVVSRWPELQYAEWPCLNRRRIQRRCSEAQTINMQKQAKVLIAFSLMLYGAFLVERIALAGQLSLAEGMLVATAAFLLSAGVFVLLVRLNAFMVKRRNDGWLRLPSWVLLMAAILLSIGFGSAVARRVKAARDRDSEAAKAIEELGGRVIYEFGSGSTINTALAWLCELLGAEDWSVKGRIVNFNSTPVTDPGLEHLRGLTELRVLYLNGTWVTDAGLRHLRGLTQLKRLELESTQVTDAGLMHLRGLTQLRRLYLDRTQVTDAGLVHLQGLTHLEEIHLGNTQVTDAGLKHLERLTHLQVLGLYGTQITDPGVAELKKALPNLTIFR